MILAIRFIYSNNKQSNLKKIFFLFEIVSDKQNQLITIIFYQIFQKQFIFVNYLSGQLTLIQMIDRKQAKTSLNSSFRKVDDWVVKRKEKEIQNDNYISKFVSDENDEIIFKNAYKNFDEFVNNVFSSDKSIKDYLRGRNSDQQKVYDSNFQKGIQSRSQEHQAALKKKMNFNNSPQHSPLNGYKNLHNTNLKKVNNKSPQNNNIISSTSYGYFRDQNKKENDFFSKTSHLFKSNSKIQQNLLPKVKVHKYNLQDSSLKSPSKISKEGSLKFINSSIKEGSLKVNSKVTKEGSINNSPSKPLPFIELEASKLIDMQMPDENSNMYDFLKEQGQNIQQVENDIVNNHFLSSKMLFQNSKEVISNNSTTFLLQNSQRILGDSEFISPPKRLFSKHVYKQIYVNIYRLHNLIKNESQKDVKFNLRLPLSCIQILNMLYEFTQDEIYKTLSQISQKYIFCYDSSIINLLSNHLKISRIQLILLLFFNLSSFIEIDFQNKTYCFWELFNEVCKILDSSNKDNEILIQNLRLQIQKQNEELSILQKENDLYKQNIENIQKKCEDQFANEKTSILDQLQQKIKENQKLQDEMSLYKKQIKTQEGIFMQNEAEMKMFTKQLENEFSTSIQQMEKNIFDLNNQNTSYANKIIIMQDSYAAQLVSIRNFRERIFDLESKMGQIIEENSRLNARAGTNFYELTPRPSFTSLDQILNTINNQDQQKKQVQTINFKLKSTQKKVHEKAKQIQTYINGIKQSYENKIQELSEQQQISNNQQDLKKKVKQKPKVVQKDQKDIKDQQNSQQQRYKVNPYQATSQISKMSLGTESEEVLGRSAVENDLEKISSSNINKKPTHKDNSSINLPQKQIDFESLNHS
ncbi:hypothetical protein TTHERM_01159900 (macronuclear) [Tetrahymena thermophila SB210]|uniref:Uncharacterized protein n=1 Tax=Tetrahymena thermophila (strain SB210) TaxID=312017 RepID=Q23NE6_TETTS|nr:hypothetical protein TTHERM_01159900 [Tetrahymena thermophila SB210]EAR98036.2 hypothetical protein TTHERM_01159900 [Tetrahymena thermophila SB210]|eukprot:XP_001018281.2 hypothetical protein TTHERM_01159900 [Tetrahymena thermophila SB210]